MDFSLFSQYSQYMMGLGSVLVLIGGLAWAFQKLNLFGPKSNQRHNGTSLHLLSALQLDPKRRLVAVEFNRRKHLILLGHSSELLIESEDLTRETGYKPDLTTSLPAREKTTESPSKNRVSPPPFDKKEDIKPHLPLPKELHL